MGIEVIVRPIGQTPCLTQWEWKVAAGRTVAVGVCFTRQAAALMAEDISQVIERYALEVVL